MNEIKIEILQSNAMQLVCIGVEYDANERAGKCELDQECKECGIVSKKGRVPYDNVVSMIQNSNSVKKFPLRACSPGVSQQVARNMKSSMIVS